MNRVTPSAVAVVLLSGRPGALQTEANGASGADGRRRPSRCRRRGRRRRAPIWRWYTSASRRRAELRATVLDRALSAARTDADGIAAETNRPVTGVRHASTGTSFDPYGGARFEGDGGGGAAIQPAPVTASVDVTREAA